MPTNEKTFLCGCTSGIACPEHVAPPLVAPPLRSLTEASADAKVTIYLSPTSDEQRRWIDADLCPFCGSNCGSDSCRLRICDSCTSLWIADTEADLDFGRVAAKEDCDPCKAWMATAHLMNPAPSFVYGDQ